MPGPANSPDDPAAGSRQHPLERARARTEAKNQAAREALEPLAPGERPAAVTVASIAAMVFAVINFVAFLFANSDAKRDGRSLTLLALICGVLVVSSFGMWRAKYWAVLGFQTFLGIQIIFLSLALTRVESALVALLFTALVVASGVLFWFLIRAMARIQMPESPTQKQLRELRAEAGGEHAARGATGGDDD